LSIDFEYYNRFAGLSKRGLKKLFHAVDFLTELLLKIDLKEVDLRRLKMMVIYIIFFDL
jgi:hypothetical protein